MPRTYCHGSIWTVNALAFHPEGLILASAGQAVGRLWDVTTGAPLLRFGTGTPQVSFISFDPEGKRLAFGSVPHRQMELVGLLEMEFGRGIYPLLGFKAAARKVWFSQDGQRLAALSDNWNLGIWTMGTRRLICMLEVPSGFLADNAGGAFDSNGERFAFASGEKACVFDLAAGGAVIQSWPLATVSRTNSSLTPRAACFCSVASNATNPRSAFGGCTH